MPTNNVLRQVNSGLFADVNTSLGGVTPPHPPGRDAHDASTDVGHRRWKELGRGAGGETDPSHPPLDRWRPKS